MTREKHVFLEDDGSSSGRKAFLAVDHDDNLITSENTLWFESAAYIGAPGDWHMDCAAIGLIFLSMLQNRTHVLHGTLSSSLAENLEEFQLAWARWCPDRYTVVDIHPDAWDDTSSASTTLAICAFSGGVDGSFTAWRHISKAPGRHHKDIRAGLLIQGFDIPLAADEAFATALESASAMLEGMTCQVIPMRTNLTDFLPDWTMNFGAGVAACLHSCAPLYGCGLMGSDEAYDQLVIPWGSNPITTPLLSSSRFRVLYDGTGYTRTERSMHIANWPGAMKHLRVCWEGPLTGRNCCACEKCIRTILNFRAAGVPRPEAFERDVSDDQIRGMNIQNEAQLLLLKEIHTFAQGRNVDASWMRALKDRLDAASAAAQPRETAARSANSLARACRYALSGLLSRSAVTPS
jgi:hypothetical protein